MFTANIQLLFVKEVKINTKINKNKGEKTFRTIHLDAANMQ